MSSQLLEPIAKIGGRVRWLGIGLAVLGVISVVAPQATGMAVSVVVGGLLVLGGIGRVSFAWLAPGWGSAFLRAAVGVLTIIAGCYMVAQPDVGSRALAIVLVFYLIADGMTSMLFAFRLPPLAGRGWLMLGAVASLLIAVLMWMQWPASGELAIGLLIGIKLILDGTSLIGIGSMAKAAA